MGFCRGFIKHFAKRFYWIFCEKCINRTYNTTSGHFPSIFAAIPKQIYHGTFQELFGDHIRNRCFF